MSWRYAPWSTRLIGFQQPDTLLAGGLCPAQSHSNLTYTNTGGISEYLLSAPLVRRPGASRLAAQQRFFTLGCGYAVLQ